MKRSKYMTIIFMAVVLCMVCVSGVFASDSKNCQITLTIPELYALTLADATLAATASQSDFLAGYIDLTQTSATCTANHGWKLTLNTSGFGAVSGYTKPVTDVEILTSGSYDTTYASRTAVGAVSTDYTVATHTSGLSGDVTNIDYRILIDSDDVAGDYNITFVYTLASNA